MIVYLLEKAYLGLKVIVYKDWGNFKGISVELIFKFYFILPE